MAQTHTCDISGESFLIYDDEVAFLRKIAPTFDGETFEVPLPKISPDERMRLRTLHRNEQFLYKNISAFTEKPLVSLYRPESGAKVVTREEWFSDSWDALDYGQDMQLDEPFFDQFSRLQKKIPRAATVTLNNQNSDYTTGTGYCKNCYLINCSEYCEGCYYSKLLQSSKNCIDCSFVYDSELLYQCFNCEECFSSQYLIDCTNCSDCVMCKSCIGCRDCFGCINLKNKQYFFQNEDCGSKEVYEKRVQELGLSDYKSAATHWSKFQSTIKEHPQKYAHISKCESCTGDFINNSRECYDCYDVSKSEFCRYLQVGVECRSVMDSSNMYIKPEMCYQTLGTIEVYGCHFCLYVFHSRDMWYCEQCFSCENCFGCVGLRNKKYCIFNKQYSQNEYGKKVAQIIRMMQSLGEWGRYFPASLSPFAYNESVANDYLPLSQEQSQDRGYAWFNGHDREHRGDVYEPLSIDQYDESKVGEEQARKNIAACLQGVLRCEDTGRPYKIIRQELIFYIRHQIPIPRVSPDVRHTDRMGLRNPRKLYQRKCCNTGETLWSPFSPESKIKLLSEEEFQKSLR